MATAIIIALFILLLFISLKKLNAGTEAIPDPKRKLLVALLIITLVLFLVWLMVMVLEVGQHMKNM